MGQSIESCLGDWTTALFTSTEAPTLDPLQGTLNHPERVFFGRQQAESEFLLEVVAAQFSHVNGHGGVLGPVAMGAPRQSWR